MRATAGPAGQFMTMADKPASNRTSIIGDRSPPGSGPAASGSTTDAMEPTISSGAGSGQGDGLRDEAPAFQDEVVVAFHHTVCPASRPPTRRNARGLPPRH